MKKILSIIAVALVFALSFSSCDNRPPYVRLAAAIDSLNAQYQEEHNTDAKLITYDKWENELHFHTDFPGVIDSDAFEPIAENIKELFLESLVTDNEFGIATEILDAKANVVIDIKGLNDTSYEILIVTNEITAAYDKAREAEANLDESAEENPYDLSPEQVQHELEEGNVTTVE